MKIRLKDLIDEDVIWDCLVWYFEINETNNNITIVFDVPHYRLQAYYEGGDLPARDFRMIVFENVESVRLYFKKLFSKPGTYDNFVYWIKEKSVEIEKATILDCENKKVNTEIEFGQYGRIQFTCNSSILYFKKSLQPIHKIDDDQLYLVKETEIVVSVKELCQTKNICEMFFK